MPKHKPARKLPSIDMTAMVDMAFLLLTFFILTAKFRADDAAKVDVPASVSDIKTKADQFNILIDKEGKVFVGFGNANTRQKVLEVVLSQNPGMTITEDGAKYFNLQASFGVPKNQFSGWLSLPKDKQKDFKHPGIPVSEENNELKDWIKYGRTADPKMVFSIKADVSSEYPVVKDVFNTLQDMKINKFNLITTLESAPSTLE